MKPNFAKLIFALAMSLTAAYGNVALAQTLACDDGTLHWEADIQAGLNSDGWQAEIGCAYFPVQFLGVKASVGLAGEIEELGYIIDYYADSPYYYEYRPYTLRFKFTPSLVLRSPKLIEWKNQGGAFHIFTEPGLVLSPGARGSHDARVCCWSVKCGVNLQIDRVLLYVGYGASNFTLYSGDPDNYNGLPEHPRRISHSAFVGTAFKF